MASKQIEFWSKVAERYDGVVDLQIGPGTRSLVLERVKRERGLLNLVEFGCGTGYYTEVLAGRSDSVVATDLSSEMLALAKKSTKSENVTFQSEDCESTTFADQVFDTAFMSLVIHFTTPERTLAEMHRILKPGGTLIICNLDPGALSGFARIRSLIRIIYRGAIGYRLKPPKRFGNNVMTEGQLHQRLRNGGFEILSTETIRDSSRSSNIPAEYIRAVRV